MIVIVDSGVANFNSVKYMLQRLGARVEITAEAHTIQRASHVILPGVGTANVAMQQLGRLNLINVLTQLTQPVLGICLGMQLMYQASAEGNISGLAILPGKAELLQASDGMPLPHMGWNTLQLTQASPLLKHINEDSYVYFVHSYAVPVNAQTCATTSYGETFSAICQWRNFYATQFHPERSGDVGAQIMKNFLEL